MHPVFDNEEFKHFIDYVENVWRPSTECGVIVTEGAVLYPLLKDWFDDHVKETISIGPYVDILPYGVPFELETKSKDGESMIEFLFMYKEIDKTKLTATQLSLGRNDFVDIECAGRVH